MAVPYSQKNSFPDYHNSDLSWKLEDLCGYTEQTGFSKYMYSIQPNYHTMQSGVSK